MPEIIYNTTGCVVSTPFGDECFHGIRKMLKDSYAYAQFSNGVELKCSTDHIIMTNDGPKCVIDLTSDDEVLTTFGGCFLVQIQIIEEPIEVYDLIEVGSHSVYYTNGILSHNCEFLGSTGTLINPAKLRNLTFHTPKKSIHGLDVYDAPIQGHLYAIAVDTAQGKGRDYHAVQVIDVTKLPYVQVAKYRNHNDPVMVLPNIIEKIGRMYNNASVLVEVMDTGMQVADMLHYDLEYENLIHVTVKGRHGQIVGGGFSKTFQRGLKMSPQARRQGCMNLKTLVEQDKLVIQDFDTIRELTTFASNGKNGKFEAEEGCHDDLVMALVVFSWLAAQRYFRESGENMDVRLQLEQENRNWIEDDMIVPLMIDDGLNNTIVEMDKSGNIWTPVSK